MRDDDGLVGRTAEQEALSEALAATHPRAERVALLAGEAGVGKTRLLDVCLAGTGRLARRACTSESATPPYGPIASALRAYLRSHPAGLADCDTLSLHDALPSCRPASRC